MAVEGEAGGQEPLEAVGLRPHAASRILAAAPRAAGAGVPLRVRPLYVAVAGLGLGVACGLWLTGWRSPRMPRSLTPAATTRAAGRAEPESAAPTSSAAVAGESSTVHAAPTPTGAGPETAEARPRAAGEDSARRPPVNDDAPRRKGAAPVPAEVAAGPRRATRTGSTGRAGGRCSLSLSANSLSLRAGGGSATLTAALDDLNGHGGVTAATRNWRDIAVFAEPGGGRGGRVRYTVIAVSKRPGTYAVTFQSPCGVRAVSVNVRQP